jgi:ubiquinol-cytochrome c reductase cytochrome b subunit
LRIVPDWWVLPIYSVLRAIPIKFAGVVAAVAAIFGLFMLLWIILADAKRRLYRPIALLAGAAFVMAILMLGYSGAHEPDEAAFPGSSGPILLDANLNSHMWLVRCATAYYFAYIVAIAPALGWRRKPDAAAVFA